MSNEHLDPDDITLSTADLSTPVLPHLTIHVPGPTITINEALITALLQLNQGRLPHDAMAAVMRHQFTPGTVIAIQIDP
jgi:hypothetical protein